MDEKEKLLTEIGKLREIVDKQDEVKIKSPEEYIADMRLYGDIPKDQYAHQFKLLYHPQTSETYHTTICVAQVPA